MSFTYHSRFLSNPVIREAKLEDAESIANVMLGSNSEFINSVFRNRNRAKNLLIERHTKYTNGIFVLEEAGEIIGVMKLQLPDNLHGNTISYFQLMKHLGIKEGIRAGILLSHWDEYKLKPNEAYIEYLYVHSDWESFNVKDLLIDQALHEASLTGATYVTNFIPVTDYKQLGDFGNRGFIQSKKIHSPLAKLLNSTYTAWYRTTYSYAEQPATVKERVADKIDIVKFTWQQRRREIFAATRLVLALTLIPIVGGTLAYQAGSEDFIIGLWVLLGITHLLGAKFYLSGSTIWRYGLMITLFAEGTNLFLRAINTTSWFNRSWLLPMALTNFWIISVLFRNPNGGYDPTMTTA